MSREMNLDELARAVLAEAGPDGRAWPCDVVRALGHALAEQGITKAGEMLGQVADIVHDEIHAAAGGGGEVPTA